MIIQCEACKRKFRVDESKIAPPGVKVRCSKCGDVFFFEYKIDSGEVVKESEQIQETTPTPPPQEIDSEEKVVEKVEVSAAPPEIPEPKVNDVAESGVEVSVPEDVEVAPQAEEVTPEVEKDDIELPEPPEVKVDVPEIKKDEIEPTDSIEPESDEPKLDNLLDKSLDEILNGDFVEEEEPPAQVVKSDLPSDNSEEDEVIDKLETDTTNVDKPNLVDDIPNEQSQREIEIPNVENNEVKVDEVEHTNYSTPEIPIDSEPKEEIDGEAAETQEENGPGSEFKSFVDLEVDSLDDLKLDQQASSSGPKAQPESGYIAPPMNNEDRLSESTSFRSPNLTVDQDVLEQTYARGTVAKSTESYSSTVSPAARRTFKFKNKKSFSGRLFSWFFTLLILGTLFFSSMFVLNETKIYENDYFSMIKGLTDSNFLSDNSKKRLLKSIAVRDRNADWYSSKYGKIYVVSGEIINRSNVAVNFVKLRSQFILTGEKLFEQEFYSGNTLTNWEIKNSSFEALNRKLNKKKGDLNYEDVDNLAGLNFDIQPGESIPFYTVFPSKNKILGLKHKIKVIDIETTNVEEKS